MPSATTTATSPILIMVRTKIAWERRDRRARDGRRRNLGIRAPRRPSHASCLPYGGAKLSIAGYPE